METLYTVGLVLNGLVGLGLGLFVLRAERRSRVHVTWALTSSAFAVWAIGLALTLFNPDYGSALFWARTSNYAAAFIPVFFAHFALALLGRPLGSSTVVQFGYAFVAVLGLVAWTPWFVPSLSRKGGFDWYLDDGPGYVAFTVEFALLVIYAHGILYRELGRLSAERQNQIKWVAVSTLVSFVCGSTTFFLSYGIPMSPLPALGSFLYAGFISYAILKHGLMDIRVAITRSGIFLLTYGSVLGLPFALGWFGRAWLRGLMGEHWWMAPLAVCTALAMVGPLFYASLRKQVERVLRLELARTKQEASTDPLTGALNRRYFFAQAREALADAREREGSFCLLLADLDHFKSVNDGHGHLVGDKVLSTVAATLRDGLREGDLLGRFGGEEFVVVLQDVSFDAGRVIAERLRDAVSSEAISAGKSLLRQTVSIGIATFPDHGSSVEELVARADAALYEAKEGGRNRVEPAQSMRAPSFAAF